jgi:integrase/recombinase XerD
MPNSLRQKSAEHSAKRRGWKSHLGRVGIIREPAFWRLCRRRHKRHRFAVQTLIQWYRSGQDAERRLPILSTYLGHVHVSDTYWYLTSCPELMGLAVKRLEEHWEKPI